MTDRLVTCDDLYDDEKRRYYLRRFMIDSDFQRLGFGKLVMDLVHDYVVGRPGGDKVYLSYVPARAVGTLLRIPRQC